MANDSRVVRRPVLVPALDRYASVLAVVPHYRCEAWLAQCLDSLLSQTRPLQRIVVVDDHSGEPPVDIVRRFPGVTLLASEENVGPYRLIQAVFDQTRFDAYLISHADDWSARERLEVLLAEAERTGAELLGSQEVRIHRDEADALTIRYPLDVNAAMEARPPTPPLLHPTSLIARSLLDRLGGFATGLRSGADLEFLVRAALAARVVNVPEFLYFRRIRPRAREEREAAARAPVRDEALGSPWGHVLAATAVTTASERNGLAPSALAQPVSLVHHCGPPLNAVATRPSPKVAARVAAAVSTARPADARPQRGGEDAEPAPVFVIGAPRSSVNLLVWCLGQHPNLPASLDSAWIGHLAVSLQKTVAPFLPDVDSALPGDPPPGGPRARPPAEVWRAFGETAHRLVAPSPSKRWVDGSTDAVFHVYGLRRLFPRARFIHVVRDAAGTVASLVRDASGDGFHTETSALDFWVRASRAGLEAERALGSGAVLRVRHEDMVRTPEAVIRRCLRFLDEPYFEGCTWPLTTIGREGDAAAGGASALPPASARIVRELEAALLAEAEPHLPGHGLDVARFGRAFGTGRTAAPKTAAPRPQRLRDAVAAATPPGAVVLVVDAPDVATLEIEGREARCFGPVDAEGAGRARPADSAEAIAWLERQRALGAEYVVFPSAAFWWLDAYPAFRYHLERVSRASIHRRDSCRIYALQPPGVAAGAVTPAGALAAHANGAGRAAAPAGPRG